MSIFSLIRPQITSIHPLLHMRHLPIILTHLIHPYLTLQSLLIQMRILPRLARIHPLLLRKRRQLHSLAISLSSFLMLHLILLELQRIPNISVYVRH